MMFNVYFCLVCLVEMLVWVHILLQCLCLKMAINSLAIKGFFIFDKYLRANFTQFNHCILNDLATMSDYLLMVGVVYMSRYDAVSRQMYP